jgi:AcrR family transcriptional regulator
MSHGVAEVTGRSQAATSPSRRAENKARTRHALVEAALDLFAGNGYDETTTMGIAEAAGVSPRTFFRYFPTKESLLFFGRYDFVRSFTGVFLAQAPDLSDLDAMATAFVVLAPGVERIRERIARYEQIIASSPALRGREQEEYDQNVEMIGAAIAERRGFTHPDPSCRLLARVGLVVLQQAMTAWLAGGREARFARAVTAEFDRFAELTGFRRDRLAQPEPAD